MNRDMLKAGLEHFSRLQFDPNQTGFVYAEKIGPDHPRARDGRVLQHSLMWHEVAAAALARIEALEQAEWFVKLPEDQQWKRLQREHDAAMAADSAAHRLLALNDRQAETIRRLQKELDESNQALRA